MSHPHLSCNFHGHNGYVQLEVPTPEGKRVRFALEIEYREGVYRVYWNAPNDIPCRNDIYVIGEE